MSAKIDRVIKENGTYYYVSGLTGTAMASVAVALSHAGHAISGSHTQPTLAKLLLRKK